MAGKEMGISGGGGGDGGPVRPLSVEQRRTRIAIERETDVTLNDQPYNTELLPSPPLRTPRHHQSPTTGEAQRHG